MATFNFKSSGTTRANAVAQQLAVTPPQIGILTPISLANDGTNNLLNVSTDLSTQLADNLKNLILTNWGERLGNFKFGANLRPLMTELVSLEDFDTKAISQIRDAVGTWMPYIDLQDFMSQVDTTQNSQTAVVNLTITYNIPSLNVVGRKLRVTLYAI